MHDRPEQRNEILDAELPPEDDVEALEELIWATVDEFIDAPKFTGGTGNRYHLSPVTFPGGELDEDDYDGEIPREDLYPFCEHNGAEALYRRKAVEAIPVRYRGVCKHCRHVFRHYAQHGTIPESKTIPPSNDGGSRDLYKAAVQYGKENYANADGD